MKQLIKKTLRVIVLTILPLALWSTNGYCISPQQIYIWVARQMNIEYVSSMPEINYVGKERLQAVFQDFSQKSYNEMASNFGKDYAEEIIGLYLDNIVGLFHTKTRTIYIGEFLEPCRRRAILAHEFVHYFQDLVEGAIDPDDYRAGDKRTFREMEAYQMERKFEQLFCSQDAHPDLLMAFIY